MMMNQLYWALVYYGLRSLTAKTKAGAGTSVVSSGEYGTSEPIRPVPFQHRIGRLKAYGKLLKENYNNFLEKDNLFRAQKARQEEAEENARVYLLMRGLSGRPLKKPK
jgi:hypothetical protein